MIALVASCAVVLAAAVALFLSRATTYLAELGRAR
jgi:hypothetical protein